MRGKLLERPARLKHHTLITRLRDVHNRPEWVALRIHPGDIFPFSTMRRPFASVVLAILGAFALSACQREEPRSYTVRKPPATTPAPEATRAGDAPGGMPALPPGHPTLAGGTDADAMMRNTPVNTAVGPELAWTAPAAWTTGPARPMRKGTLLIPGDGAESGAELAITAFPGDVGGNLANVNRWRQQLGLGPIAAAELGATLRHLHVGDLHIDVVELVGPATPPAAPQRVLGAIVPYSGATWFFKLTGPDALVAREREQFLAFVRTIRPAS